MPDVILFPWGGFTGSSTLGNWRKNWPGGTAPTTVRAPANKPNAMASLGANDTLWIIGHGAAGLDHIGPDVDLFTGSPKGSTVTSEALAKILNDNLPGLFSGTIVLLVCEGGKPSLGTKPFAENLADKLTSTTCKLFAFNTVITVGWQKGIIEVGLESGNPTARGEDASDPRFKKQFLPRIRS